MIDEKQKTKLLKGFSKIYKVRTEPQEEITEYKDNDFFTTECNVLGVEFQDLELKKWFNYNFDVSITKSPELSYNGLSKSESKINQEYLSKALTLFKSVDIKPILKVGYEYPITLEAEGLFKVIIAPVVD